MRYLTKEWYNKMQSTSLHFWLTIDKRAEVFSEVFYQRLREKEKKGFIKIQSVTMNYEEYKNIVQKAGISIDNDKLKENFKLMKDPFNGMTLDEYFDYCQSLKKKEMKEILPKSILNKVKDIRVLALGYVSKDVYHLIKNYCGKNEKFVAEKFDEYSELVKETFQNEKLEFLECLFHDSYIEEMKREKRDVTFIINNEQSFTDKESITFKNCNVILDEDIEKTYWLYDEVYKTKAGYEVHILTSDNNLKEFIIECEDIILR